LTAAALAEAVAMVAAPVFGIDAPEPDPAVPPADLAAALAGIASTLLDCLPDKGAQALAAFGAMAARAANPGKPPTGGHEDDQP